MSSVPVTTEVYPGARNGNHLHPLMRGNQKICSISGSFYGEVGQTGNYFLKLPTLEDIHEDTDNQSWKAFIITQTNQMYMVHGDSPLIPSAFSPSSELANRSQGSNNICLAVGCGLREAMPPTDISVKRHIAIVL